MTTAAHDQAEQELVATMERNTATLQRIIMERDKFRDALRKIEGTQFAPLEAEEKHDRMHEIAAKALGSWIQQ